MPSWRTCVAGAVLFGVMSAGAWGGPRPRQPEGFDIAMDPSLFSSRFRTEFEDMNRTFGEFGFELEVLNGEQPRLSDVVAKYGPAPETDEIEVMLFVGDRETRATLRFYYYGDVGFGVRPDDADGLIVRAKRKED